MERARELLSRHIEERRKWDAGQSDETTLPFADALFILEALNSTEGLRDVLVDMRRAAFAGGWSAAMGGGGTGTFDQRRADWERDNALPALSGQVVDD